MKKYYLAFIVICVLLGETSCESNKISCPTYANSFPEKKVKQAKPGSQKPTMQRYSKPKSDVTPRKK